jgi:deoxyribonuclease (pyrimidine dimer)
MTRVNAGVDPSELHRLHLIAEYREIPMIPASLRRSLRTRTLDSILRDVPTRFTLNRGHVTFFADKLGYLSERYERVKSEMRSRNYFVDPNRDPGFIGLPEVCYGGWTETPEARQIILDRIAFRKSEKPHIYT